MLFDDFLTLTIYLKVKNPFKTAVKLNNKWVKSLLDNVVDDEIIDICNLLGIDTVNPSVEGIRHELVKFVDAISE